MTRAWLDLDGDAVGDRSLTVVGSLDIAYGLAHGGRNPLAPSPADAVGEADCSAYALAWAQGLDRYQPLLIDGEYLWTDGAIADLLGPRRCWDPIVPDAIQRGDAVIIRSRRHPITRKRIPGHCGVVVEPGPTIAACRVAHCHGPHGRRPAIEVRDGRPWRNGYVGRLNRAKVRAVLGPPAPAR